MDIAQFKKKAVVESFNTNNGWGFGGSVGKSYSYNGLLLKIGKWCYRHAPSESFNHYYDREGVATTKREFEELISELK